MHFRGPDVRAAAQQIGGHVDDDGQPGLRDDVFARGHFRQRARGSGEQCAQRILRLPQHALQLRDRGQRAEILGLRLLHIQLGIVAALEQQLRDVQAAFLKSGIFASDHQPRFHGPDRAVEGGHLRGHQHLHVIVLGDAGEIAGIRGLDAALELAPEIDFPADAEPGVQGHRSGIRCARPPLPCAEHGAGCLLHLRVERAAGNSELGARFHDAHAGDPHVGIHALRLGNQAVEHGIVEVAPPLLRLSAARDSGSAASDSREPPVQSASQGGTCGRLKSGPTVVQALSITAPASPTARRRNLLTRMPRARDRRRWHAGDERDDHDPAAHQFQRIPDEAVEWAWSIAANLRLYSSRDRLSSRDPD